MNRMKVMLVALSVMGLVFSSRATTVDGELSEGGTVLTVEVGSGEADFGTGHLSALTGNTVTRFVKTGAGRLVMPAAVDLSAYRGTITVAGGVYRFQTAKGVGALTGDGTGVLTVDQDGALEAAPASDVTLDLRGKTIVFAGAGPDGAGALRAAPAGNQYGGWIFGTNLVMTGNATLSVLTKYEIALGTGSAAWWLDMGGHDLEVRPYAEEIGKNDRNVRFQGEMHVKNPGNIVFAQGDLTLRDLTANATLGGTAVNTLTMTSGVNGATKLTFSKSKLNAPWTLRWHTDRDIDVASTTTTATTNENVWAGPVYLGEKMGIKFGVYNYYQRMTLGGKVSGSANIFLTSASDAGGYTDGCLNLLSGENDFSGAVVANHATLYLETSGALPASGAGFIATNATLALKDGSSFVLPGATFDGDSAVVGGEGAWTKPVVKTGAGTLSYASLAGGSELEIRSGTVSVEPTRSAAMAGWIVGCMFYPSEADGLGAYESEIVHSNAVELSPAMAYNNGHSYWKTKYALITVSGYLWNNTDSDVTWSFVTAMGNKSKLKINGALVCSDMFWDPSEGRKSCGYGDAVLHPGANPVTLWIYTAATDRGPTCLGSAESPLWEKSNFGFVYDSQGRNAAGNIAAGADGWVGKHAYSYYSQIGDDGTGSLVTWVVPGTDVACVKPGTDETVCLQPVFAHLKGDTGATLDLGGNARASVTDLSGALTIANCGTFGVTGAWTLDASSLTGTLTAAGKLDFTGAALALPDAASVKSGSFVIATAEGGIVAQPTLPDELTAKGWELSCEDDGKSLHLKKNPSGLILLFR